MQEQPQKKRSAFNWFGIIVFLLFAVGPSLWRFVNRMFSGAGLALPGGLPWPVLVIGAIVLAVFVSVAIQGVQRAQSRSETRLPTTMSAPPPTSVPMPQRRAQSNMPMPPFGGELGPLFPNFPPPSDATPSNATPRLPSRAPQLPRPPRFEPIISGKAVLAASGLIGLFGLVYLLATAVMP
jgi:hypothetical protein